ncbi:hypothetical protein COU12_02510 [Candidatus Jorgensenbacteria bacterium CG10_big_fil_rev_8_21_14_0_10_54_38]|uniref:POTRA domain-containing protein n=2 Tax=Candidatus Joergenseniibacteriota TaxID=1752739 RepID=A0A2M6WFI1_9BACT|nr:MAG: hypothetical protein COX26_01755 [Candidatus Jorgensenbacteria bacterium CG23_combo_of_CG06-09_8_20_14_all_54_14]PIT91542.1 MAG: hypothetical protein COU12_02510 [Candidatus Jorgensenbacteria bacterium CG10_big_fil_rev_8_21_14_0_10_54_38]
MYRPETDTFRETRRKKPRRVLWWLIGFFSLFVLLAAGAGYAVLFSSLFEVQAVEVSGGETLPREQLLAALSAQLTDSTLRGLTGPGNILFWMFRGSEPRQLYTASFAAEVTVVPRLLERKVEVAVRKLELFGVWCAAESLPARLAEASAEQGRQAGLPAQAGPCYGFDRAGTLVGEAPAAEGALILKVSDENRRSLVAGQPALPNPRWVKNLLETIAVIKAQNLPVAEFTVKPLALHEWWARLASGTLIYFSFDFVPENLSAILENFKTKPDFTKLLYLDLRVPSRVYYR